MAQGAPMDDAAAIQAVIDHMASAWNRGDDRVLDGTVLA